MNLVSLNHVSHSYELDGEKIPILSDISFDIEAGEMVAIQGPSGSGKSTLLNLLGGFLRLQEGRLSIAGAELAQLSDRALAQFRNQRLGYVFQQFNLLPRTRVIDNILMPTQYGSGRKPKERALQLAQYLGISDRLDHMPNQLSGGQQQRVAIARALINDPDIILADEPTGNLDSQSSQQTLELFHDLHRQGKTLIIITHDPEVARQCQRILHIHDGQIIKDERLQPLTRTPQQKLTAKRATGASSGTIFKAALRNLTRQKVRTALTMLGVVIGIASVISMVTLGEYTKKRILDSYAEMGVNTLRFFGYPNWALKAKDRTPVMFRSFDWELDLLSLKRVFPEVETISPVLASWGVKVSYGGKELTSDVTTQGVTAEALPLMGREIDIGRNINSVHVDQRSSVCVVGSDIVRELFRQTSPLGKILSITAANDSFTCRIIGTLVPTSSSKEWSKPNLQIYMPFTYFQAVSNDWWSSQIRQAVVQLRTGSDPEKTAAAIKAFYSTKYGKSGRFDIDSDSVLINQMSRFLNLFTVLLGAIALISLAVGGIGITNMMLVSVSERFREIGLRKALGATDSNIRDQFLLEAFIVCCIAGIIGVIGGFSVYEAILYLAAKFTDKITFAWIFDARAIVISFVSIVVVGVLSGYFPALKAKRLSICDALRTE